MKASCWAIIPARSGSKGLKDKNITKLLDKVLIAHSINFAKKLSFVDKVFLSTDSEKYAKIGIKAGAEVPFLRSSKAANDLSMEEDILEDIRIKCFNFNVKPPDNVIWLRPTHPLRCLDTFQKAYKKFIQLKKSICVVSSVDPRIFLLQSDGSFKNVVKKFDNKSMVRRQECPIAFKIFFGEIFKFPKKYNDKFLGDNFDIVFQPKICDFDIDTIDDLNAIENQVKSNKDFFRKYLHLSI